MYVIFPAEELILMTYGASIPRIAPRPTLDCLREPKVPIYIPIRSQPKSIGLQSPLSATIPSVIYKDPVLTSSFIVPESVTVPFNSEINLSSLSPRPSPLPSANRVSLTSLQRAPSVPRTPQLPSKLQTEAFQRSPSLSPKAPMYNDLKMRSAQQQQEQQQQQQQQQQGTNISSGSRRPTLERGTAISSGSTLLRSPTTLDAIYDEEETASGGGDYAAGSAKRERSPSILLDLAPIDPTQPRLGPGWGRPMSPMDLPPEKSSSRSPKLLLKPKLHIPLGKLGRSVSSEPRESHRLREDLQLHVENPIFNTENLRQRNFDVFFDAGEPVYKLQPKSPLSASTDTASGGSNSPPLSNYAGVYDPVSKKNSKTTKGGLFARSPREDRALMMRSKSTDHYDEPRSERSVSLGAGGAASTGSGGGAGAEGGGGSGSVPQKGDSGPKSRNLFGWRGPHSGSLNPALSTSMASYTGVLKDYGHISLNEAFKSQNNVNFKLIKTVGFIINDFLSVFMPLYTPLPDEYGKHLSKCQQSDGLSGFPFNELQLVDI
uniref:Uncharacterized protein n=1 Tax=Glossina brevipalpis TaxID=37001 RepID=A0A1A9WWL5_9MUSC